MVLKLLFCDDKGREVRIFVIGAEVEVVGRLWLGGVGWGRGAYYSKPCGDCSVLLLALINTEWIVTAAAEEPLKA